MAAEQGHDEAQCQLGLILYSCDDGANPGAEAIRWFRKAAELGNAPLNTSSESAMKTGVESNEGTSMPLAGTERPPSKDTRALNMSLDAHSR